MLQTIRIGLVGPESTGKSTIAKALAERFGGTYIEEYARAYVSRLTEPATYEDVSCILRRNMEEYEAAQGLVFFDTEAIITKVWMDVVWGQHPEELDLFMKEHPMDYYLLLKPDIAWVADPTRENGDQQTREALYNTYMEEIRATNRPYRIVSGSGNERLENAIAAMEEWTKPNKR